MEQAACLGRNKSMARMRANGGNTGTMVFWDMQTSPPPPNCGFLDHLLATHRAMATGLFSLRSPLKLRAHGTAALPAAAHDYIVKSTLSLQQSISCGSEQGSCWKAMIVDMLLWAVDHAPGMADVVIISRVLDRSLADVIHQLHVRNYNVIVAPSFPPKDMTPLHRLVPPQIETLLHQMFSPPDSLSKTTVEVAVEAEAVIANGRDETVSIKATDSQPEKILSQMTTICSLMIENCRILVEELYLRKGITEFLEYDLYASFKTRFGNKLSHKEVGFVKLDAFLQVAVPGVDFKSILVGSKPWILCSGSPGHAFVSSLTQKTDEHTDSGASQGMQISEARSTTPAPEKVSYYGPLTMEEVRNWLEELVASGRADTGINLSLLGHDFEDRRRKKLNYKSLHCPTLTVLLSKFENLVRLERNHSMMHLFPRDMQSSRRASPTVPENVPVNRPFIRPQRNCIPEVPVRPPCASVPSVVRVPAQTCITRNFPTAVMPVPKFKDIVTKRTVIVRTPTAALLTVPSAAAPATPEVEIVPAAGEQASEENRLPIGNDLPSADAAGLNEDAVEKDERECVLPKIEQISAPNPRDFLAAHKPDSKFPQIPAGAKTTFMPPPDLVRDANAASSTPETKVEQAGGRQSLPNADNTAAPTSGIEKVHKVRNGEDAMRGICDDEPGRAKKFDYYRLTTTAEEREAIKRTFTSVNTRLREEYKKRRLAHEAPVAEACDRNGNTP